MSFIIEQQELKPGLILFKRGDVQHQKWYCRMKIAGEDRYKTVSLKTTDLHDARDKAYDLDAELRFKIKHELPIFNRLFSQVAKEYIDLQKQRSEVGQITHHRWRVLDSHVRSQLNPYLGSTQITLIGPDRWREYPIWRQRTGQGRSGQRVSDGTIRAEMATLKAIVAYAAEKQYIRESQVFKDKLPLSKVQRDEFTPPEYRKLHTFARGWIKQGRNKQNIWYRTMVYNFVLIMTNTGMRPSEARNLVWKDVSVQSDKQGRQFVRLNVRGRVNIAIWWRQGMWQLISTGSKKSAKPQNLMTQCSPMMREHRQRPCMCP